MNQIGLHLRLQDSLLHLAQHAVQLRIPFFQCFFVQQMNGRLITMTDEQIASFVAYKREHFTDLYLHGSYWINLASNRRNGIRSFYRELSLAKKLEFTHMILHPGAANDAREVIEGIDTLARVLNEITKKERQIEFVLENTAHGNMSVGSDIAHFGILLSKLDFPERVSFCLDTAHAYVYGYDIVHTLDEFITYVDDTIGLSRVKLIHLNDTYEQLGSRIDRHASVGEGRIGVEALKRFVLHPKIESIPLLVEPPVLSNEQEIALLNLVRSWH